MAGRLTPEQRLRRTVEDVLAGCGFSEAYTSTRPEADGALRLPEPLSAEQAVLRTARAEPRRVRARNLDAGNEGVALFELARVYPPRRERCPTSAGTWPGSSRAASSPRRGRSRRSTAR